MSPTTPLRPVGGSHQDANQPQHVPSSRDFIPRYQGPTSLEEMTPEQLQLRQQILDSRPRTGLSGPFGPWLAVPELCQPAQALGRFCRYGTTLRPAESELVILLTAAQTQSETEFDLHVGEALLAGLSMEFIQSIPRHGNFSLLQVQHQVLPLLQLPEEKEQEHHGQQQQLDHSRLYALAVFTSELVDTKTVSDSTYQLTKAALGGLDSVLVEVTSIIGYYTLVAYTLNVFRIPSS